MGCSATRGWPLERLVHWQSRPSGRTLDFVENSGFWAISPDGLTSCGVNARVFLQSLTGRSFIVHQELIEIPYTMNTKFQFYEFVRIIAESPRIQQSLIHKEGIIVGISDPYIDNKRDYGVHINEYMETFVFSEDLLESCGRIGKRQDVVWKSWGRGGRP